MRTLTKDLRNQLAKTVIDARDAAEVGAQKALHALGVDESDAPSHLTLEQRELRRALRAQSRQLGDYCYSEQKGSTPIYHLIEKIAYDQWHRMLFARFLAENGLLISPKHQVAVTLDECTDLAPEFDLRDGWQVAARFAAEMLPQIFRANDPAGQIVFPLEDHLNLERLVTGLPEEIFLSDDALGWVYQFWQSKRKDEVNQSEKKIGADELAPVTQLFTEDYMVQFLLDNTLGAWWASKKLDLLNGLASEIECRKALAINDIEWNYLQFTKDEKDGRWRPAAGIFNGWHKSVKEITILDPCMGSGHFLTFALPIIVAFRMEEEGLTIQQACDAALGDNIFGLELDMRCTQIGAFNIALKAWKMAGYRALPSINIACCGLGINAEKEEWLKLANGDERLVVGLEKLYFLFQKAPILGSLINPVTIQFSKSKPKESDLFSASYSELRPFLEKALSNELKDDNEYEMAVTAQGLVKAAEILATRYDLIVTNVPYLGRGKQNEILREYCDCHYSEAKADLATCFIERCLELCSNNCSAAFVSPQNWMFLGSYKKLRVKLLTNYSWNMVGKLGTKAFDTINGEVVNVSLLILSRQKPVEDTFFYGLDASEGKNSIEKAQLITRGKGDIFPQSLQLQNPETKIILSTRVRTFDILEKYAIVSEGLHTGDYPRFGRNFWELMSVNNGWAFLETASDYEAYYGGKESILFWENGNGELIKFVKERLNNEIITRWIKGNDVWGRMGIAVSAMGDLRPTIYMGSLFTHGAFVIVPRNSDCLAALWEFCISKEFSKEVRRLDQKICAARKSIASIPFDLEKWQKIASIKHPDGFIKPHSNNATQWIFNGHPRESEFPLQVAVARLLGYEWPRQKGVNFLDCSMIRSDGLEKYTDDDGIVCINSIKGELSAPERLHALLVAAFGLEWSATKQTELINQSGYAINNFEDWLRNAFFEQHCQLFLQRPFIWQIWDGRKDGFSAFVNYHKLNKSNLEKLTYTYLNDWIARQKISVEAGEEGSDARLTAAIDLRTKLIKIIEGEKPFDIFIRWKPIEKQPIGWEPDLNDGVRINIRPFVEAGILRKNPKINWSKDRGKDVESAPWYYLFNGERINDHHLTLDEKRKARGIMEVNK